MIRIKKVLFNLLLAILFSFTLFLTTISLTLCNDNYVIKKFRDFNYYEEVLRNIRRDVENYDSNCDYSISIDDIQHDIDNFVRDKFIHNDALSSKIYVDSISDANTIKMIYDNNIHFDGFFDKYSMNVIIYITYFVTLIVIFVVGSIFLKTKKKHDLSWIFMMSFGILLIIYGFIYLGITFDIAIIDEIINSFNHIILGEAIILLEIGVILKLKSGRNS